MNLTSIIAKSAIIIALTLAGNWNVDPAASKVSFTIKGPFGTVNGSFTGLEATIVFDEKNLSGSSVTASIDATTVSTGIGLRNKDLRNKELWLNTGKYPRISFHSTKIEKTGNGYKAIGNLTLKGVTKPAEIPFTFTATGSTGLFKGQFEVNREDYGIGKKGGSVGSTITVTLEVAVKK